VSTWNDKIRTDPATKAITQEWTSRSAPMVALFADTKVGKSTWLSKLFTPVATLVPDASGKTSTKMRTAGMFCPTLYIDADAGALTMGDIAYNEKHVLLRSFDEHPSKVLQWFGKRIDEAETVKCGAIVVECVNAIYELELGKAYRANPEGTPRDWAAEIGGSMRALFSSLRGLKAARNANGIGVPIFVSLNVKSQREGKGKDAPTWYVPNMSDGLRRHVTAGVDAMLELTRVGDRTILIASDTHVPPRHSIRGPSGNAVMTGTKLPALVGATNLDPAGLLACWADFCVKNAPRRPTLTSAPVTDLDGAEPPVPTPEPEPTNPETETA